MPVPDNLRNAMGEEREVVTQKPTVVDEVLEAF